MKQRWLFLSLLCSFPALAQLPLPAAEIQLQQMGQAAQSLNYELVYMDVSRAGAEPLRYRHALIGQQIYAQLLHLDGPRREVIQRNNAISYVAPGLESFSLPGQYIIDALPSLVYASFSQLSNYYDFVMAGRARIADQFCNVLRIIPRDGTRYNHVVWVDTVTNLPLRIDLLDKDSEVLEQFRVISFTIDPDITSQLQALEKTALPPTFSVSATDNIKLSWSPSWLPAGMKLLSQSRRNMSTVNKLVETQLYSDGLFSFAVSVMPADTTSTPQTLRIGRRTVQTDIRDNREITVVGELPPQTAKHITAGIQLEN